jgi:hypothetical protein
MRRWMARATLIAAAAVAAVLAGCGGDEEPQRERPKLPRQVAAALATESEDIAQALDAGEDCAAHRKAQALRAHIGDTVSGGQVPPKLGVEMGEAAETLADAIECEPAPPQPTEPQPTTTQETTPALTGCEAIAAQLEQLKRQDEQTKQGPGGPVGKELKKRLKEQAKDLEQQLKQQCGEGDGDEEDGPEDSENAPGGGPPPGRGNGGA